MRWSSGLSDSLLRGLLGLLGLNAVDVSMKSDPQFWDHLFDSTGPFNFPLTTSWRFYIRYSGRKMERDFFLGFVKETLHFAL